MVSKEVLFLVRNPKEVRNFVINVLSREHPLSAKQIFYDCRKEGASFTYQAVHKTLGQLCQENVLQKKGAKYSISGKWLKETKSFVEEVETAYSSGKRPSLSGLKPNSSFSFESNEAWVSPFYWALDEMSKYMKARNTNKTSVIVMSGAWPVWVAGRKEYEQVRTYAKQTNLKIVCSTDTWMDKLILTFWKPLRS